MHSGKPLALFIFANSKQAYLGEIPNEGDALRQLIEPETQRLGIDLKVLGYSTLDSLLEILNTNNKRLALLHFAGHSDTDWLQLDSGKAYAAGIAAKLQQCPNLQLVFLNGCNSEGLVKALVQVGIPHVIGTRQTIIDRMALAFSKGFYRALLYQAKGVSVALEQARDDVRTGYSGDFRSLDIEDPDESFGWAWFSESQSPDWRFEDIAHECNRLPRLDETKELPTKPFKNLYYYEKADAEIFFGRCKETLKVIQALDTAAEPVLLLHGGTGVGKSSFLQAGLLPRLESPSRKQEVKYKRYSDLPHYTNILVEVFGTDDLSAIRALLNNETGKGLPAIWIIDQFEEAFFDERQRSMGENGLNDADTLLTAIRALYYDAEQSKPSVKIILSLRKEWMSDARDLCIKYGVGITDVFLKPLGRDAIVEVVESLTRTNRLQAKYHLRIDDSKEQSFANLVANELLADKSSNIAPTLQIMLTRFWARVENQQERVWDKTLFQQEQREGSLLEDFLQSQLKDIAENCCSQEHGDWGKQAYESGLLLDVLYQHTNERGTARAVSAEDYEMLYSHIPYRNKLLRALKDCYLLIEPQTSNKKDLIKKTRIAHDTLAFLIYKKFNESNLISQRVRRMLDEKKACLSLYGRFVPFDFRTLRIVKLGLRSMSNADDSIYVELIRKSWKIGVRNKILSSFFSITLFLFLILAFLYYNYNIEGVKVKIWEDEYVSLLSRYKNFNSIDDKKIYIEVGILEESLKDVDDDNIRSTQIFSKYRILQSMNVMRSNICYRSNVGCLRHELIKYSNDSVEYGYRALLHIEDAVDDSSRFVFQRDSLFFEMAHAQALLECNNQSSKFDFFWGKISHDYIESYLSRNSSCLLKVLAERKV